MLSACSYFHAYRPDIQQGNILDPVKVSALRTGMTQLQVKTLLGKPVLQNTFDNNQLLYAYNFIPNRGKPIQKELILTFKNDRLVKIQK